MPPDAPPFDAQNTDWTAVAAAMTRMNPVRMPLRPIEALHLVSVLQLALRHPGLDPEHSEVGRTARRTARLLESALVRRVPTLAPLLTAGWEPANDAPVEFPTRASVNESSQRSVNPTLPDEL